MKAAVYCGTKNVYQDMIPSMKSLLIHSDVDKIYFLIEDDTFPYELPPEVECINVSNQPWFPQDGPNMQARCSYMVLLRAAFTKIFPNLDKILTIDNDTIVKENISELWDIPLDEYYLAGCAEPKKTSKKFLYINMGLAMLNLKKMREDKIDDTLIEELNTHYFIEAEQSAFNMVCQGKILELSSEYNDNNYTKKNNHKQKIVHYAAINKWQEFPLIKKYRAIEVTEHNLLDNYDLDIIIPHYNDIEGLERTIKSICYNDLINIHVTVVDDCSIDKDYLYELLDSYPEINLIELPKNSGPGAARQAGIDGTSNPYIMFIDAGDCFFEKICLINILNIIKEYNKSYIFSWDWINGEFNNYFHDERELLPGKVFKREFLELYNIKFNTTKEGSYSNEDRGFLVSCDLILKNLKLYERTNYMYVSNLPIYHRIFRKDSLTHQKDFYTKSHIQGLSYNMVHMTKICEKNVVNKILIAKRITRAMVDLYQYYLEGIKKDPSYAKENLEAIKYFYKNVYRTYEKVNAKFLDEEYHRRIKVLLSLTSSINPTININRFIGQLGD